MSASTPRSQPRMGFFTDTSRLHRLQGLRGRVQGVEPACPTTGSSFTGDVLRQHRRPGREHLAARRVHRAAGRRPATVAGMHAADERRSTAALADDLRRLQALHARRVPRRLPDRRAVPHRVRHRRRPAGHLQRLRLLRAGLPVRRDRPARGRRPGVEVHALLRPAEGRTWSRPAPRRARPTRSSSARSTSCASARRARVERAARARASTRRGSTAHDPDDGVGGVGAFFLLLDEPEVYGLPPDPVDARRATSARSWTAAGGGGGALGAAVARRPVEARRWPRARRRSPTTAGRSSSRRSGRRRSRCTSSSAGSPGASAGVARAGRGARRRRARPARVGALALRRERRQPGAADLRPRAARALPPHAAGVQADVADERRLLDPRRLRPGDRGRRGSTTRPGRAARRRAGAQPPRPCSACRWPPTPRR